MDTPIIETKRLVLRPLCLADAPQIQDKFAHFEIVQYLANIVPWPYPANGALDFLENIALPSMQKGEAWHWAIFQKNQLSDLVGVISLRLGNDNRGFWIAKEHQRQGFASEAAVAVTDYWFDVLGQDKMQIPKAICNEASVKISQRSAMRPIREEIREYVGGQKLSQIWEITKSEWQKFRVENQKPKV